MTASSARSSEMHANWLNVWQDARSRLEKNGEYDRIDKTLEVWAGFASGGSIEVSGALKQWPTIAERIRDQRFSIGLIATRLAKDDPNGCPGVSIVVETPHGGSTGAHMLLNALSAKGIGGTLARQEGEDRWGVVKLLYCPAWYAANCDTMFDIDWSRRAASESDMDESKAVWCKHVVRIVELIVREMPSALIDSVFFDCYALCDRLHEMSGGALKKLAGTSADMLGRHLIALSAAKEG